MSKQLKKQTLVIGAAGVGLGALVGHADADTIVYTNGNQGGERHGDTNVAGNANTRTETAYADYVAQLQSEYTFLKGSGGEVGDAEAELNQLKALEPTFRELQSLQARVVALQKQAVQTDAPVTISTRKVSTSEALKQAVNDLSTKLKDAEDLLANTRTVSIDSSLHTLVREANKAIEDSATTGNHYEDGIIGNMDKITRKASDSAQIGTIKSTDGDKSGVIVDTTKTTRTNLVTTTTETIVRPSMANSAEEVSRVRDEALAKIAAVNKADETQVLKADTYKDNAITNIDAINEWLQNEQNRADNIQAEIDKNLSVAKMLDTTKESARKALDQAEQLIKSSGKSQKAIDKMMETVQQARKQLDASTVTQKVTATITEAQNADFGDIGRDPSIIKGLIGEKTKVIDSKVQEALKKLNASSQAAKGPVDTWAKDTNEQVGKFLEKLKAGKFLGQVDQEWLATRKIFQTNANGYQEFVKKALALTEEDTEGVLTKTGNVWKVKNGTPTPKAAAALYNERSKQGLSEGFGSVMLPSDNVNDFVTVQGNKLANSQSFAGGAQGIIDAIVAKGETNLDTGKHVSEEPAIADVVNQHIRAVGNNKTFLVVSDQPTATFNLKDSFLYMTDNGEPKTTDMTLTLTVTDHQGNPLGNEMVNGGRTHVKYLFYMSVDAATGKLVAGGGYLLLFDAGGNTGNHNDGGSGTGELALGSDSNPANDSGTLHDWLNSSAFFFSPTNHNNPYNDKGMRLTVDVKVNPVAGSFAENSPLYIGDIDDFQSVNTGGDVVLSETSAPSYIGNGVLSNQPSRGAHNGHVNLDEQAIMTTENKAIGISHAPAGTPYQAIDIALFSPWGVIGGTPRLNLGVVNQTVETFDMADPNAKAHTEGEYAVKKIVAKVTNSANSGPKRDVDLVVPTFAPKTVQTDSDNEGKRGSSANTIVVRRKDKKVGSGNSLIVRQGVQVRVGSGNALVVRASGKSTRAGSGNSLVVREVSNVKTAGSGNTLVVKSIQGLVKATEGEHGLKLSSVSSPARVNQSTVTLNIQVDPSLKSAADEAIKDWKAALAEHGITLNVTSKPGVVGLAILDSDNVTTRAARTLESKNVSNDSTFEMKGLAGLTTTTSKFSIVDLDADDKLNKDGTYSVSDLRNTKMVVQLNTEAITDYAQQVKVLKHEIGHVFGLTHDNNDPLMMTYYGDGAFTGQITPATAAKVAQNLRGGVLCECGACVALKA